MVPAAMLFLAIGVTTNAYGYIDMNTGSYLLQIAIAGVLGALYTLRGYAGFVKNKIKALFSRKRKQK